MDSEKIEYFYFLINNIMMAAITINNSTILNIIVEKTDLQKLNEIIIEQFSADELNLITQINICGDKLSNQAPITPDNLCLAHDYTYDTNLEYICPNLHTLVISGKFNEVIIANSANLTEIYFELVEINKLQVINCAVYKIQHSLEHNFIEQINICDNTKCTHIEFYNCSIKNITIENSPNIQYLLIRENFIETIDLSEFPKLINVNLSYNKLTNIDLSKNNNVDKIALSNNKLSELDLSKNINLYNLYIDNNQIVDLTTNSSKLSTICAKNNLIKHIDLSNCISLDALYLDNNCISDLPTAQNLRVLTISNNPLCADLNELLKQFPNLVELKLSPEQINLNKNINLNINIEKNKS